MKFSVIYKENSCFPVSQQIELDNHYASANLISILSPNGNVTAIAENSWHR